MMRTQLISAFLLFFLLSTQVFAQQNDLDKVVDDTKEDFLIVVGGGLAGAVLGLSTLSFVDEPKKHTKNIMMGASLGIIVGVILVASKQATKGQEMFNEDGSPAPAETGKVDPGFGTQERSVWHSEAVATLTPQNINSLTQLNYSFSF